VLLEKCKAEGPVAEKIREMIRHHEFNEENPDRIQLKKTLGVCYVLKGLERTSQTDAETIWKIPAVMDALYATVKECIQ